MANATFLHIGTRDGLFVASKPGTSPDWHITRHTLEGRPVAAVVAGAALPVRLLAGVSDVGVFHSPNGGREWALTLPQPVRLLTADPDAPEQVFAALREALPTGADSTPGLMHSADGGLTWEPLGAIPAAHTHVLNLAITRTPGPERALWAGLASGGVLSSHDDGRHWQGLIRGLDPHLPVQALAGIGGMPPDILVATPRGFYALAVGRRADDAEWKGTKLFWRPLGVEAPQAVVALQPFGRTLTPGRGASGWLAVDSAGALWRGEATGATWERVLLAGPAAGAAAIAVTALAAHPEYPDRAYAGTVGGAIYETRNRGTTWALAGISVPGAVLALAVAVVK